MEEFALESVVLIAMMILGALAQSMLSGAMFLAIDEIRKGNRSSVPSALEAFTPFAGKLISGAALMILRLAGYFLLVLPAALLFIFIVFVVVGIIAGLFHIVSPDAIKAMSPRIAKPLADLVATHYFHSYLLDKFAVFLVHSSDFERREETGRCYSSQY
jgi:hypothetical protein